MAKKNVRPDGISSGGENYRLVVMLVHSRDEFGRVKLATIVHDDNSIDLAGNEEFITAYVHSCAVKKTKKPNGG